MKLKKIIAGVLISAVIVTVLPQVYNARKAVFAEETAAIPLPLLNDVEANSEYTYEELSDGTIWIKSYSGSERELIIPGTINGKVVTRLGFQSEKGSPACFFLNADGTYAENNVTLKITIPNTVNYIYNGAFHSGLALMEINVADGNPDYMSRDGILYRLNGESIWISAYPAGKTDSAFIAPDTVTKTESWAFVNSKVKTITLPDSMSSVDGAAFCGCFNLTSINIPTGLTSLSNRMFDSCTSLKNIVIPNSITKIETNAFCLCMSLESIVIPDSVTEMGGGVFNGCTSLTTVTLSENTDKVSDFQGCFSLKEILIGENNGNYSSQDGILYSKDGSELIAYPAAKTNTSFTVPEGTTIIKNSMFENCTYLKEIILHEGIVSIGPSAFKNCISLEKIYLPQNLTEIDDMLNGWISGCISLKEFIVNPNNTAYSSIDGVLYNKNGTELIAYPCGKCTGETVFVIPDIVEQTSRYAFLNCNLIFSLNNNPNFTIDQYGALCDKNGKVICYGKNSNGASEDTYGIYISGSRFPNVTINAEVTDSSLDTEEKSIIFDITLMVAGREFQPVESVFVRIPLPEEIECSKCRLYHRKGDGSLIQIAIYSYNDNDNSINFYTDHFSEYIITTEKLIPDSVLGDVNGDARVNDQDSILLSRYLAEWGNVIDISSADMNGDGKVNDQDSIMLARKLAGWYD